MKDNINVSDALIVLDKFVRNNSNEFESWEMVNILNTINFTSTERANNIIEIQAFPQSNDVIGLKDLYLSFAIGDSEINMIKDTITSGEQISGVGYKVTSSYSNGVLTRG